MLTERLGSTWFYDFVCNWSKVGIPTGVRTLHVAYKLSESDIYLFFCQIQPLIPIYIFKVRNSRWTQAPARVLSCGGDPGRGTGGQQTGTAALVAFSLQYLTLRASHSFPPVTGSLI